MSWRQSGFMTFRATIFGLIFILSRFDIHDGRKVRGLSAQIKAALRDDCNLCFSL